MKVLGGGEYELAFYAWPDQKDKYPTFFRYDARPHQNRDEFLSVLNPPVNKPGQSVRRPITMFEELETLIPSKGKNIGL